MKIFLSLLSKEFLLLRKDRSALFWMIGYPLLFAFFFAAIFRGDFQGIQRMAVAVVDRDRSPLSTTLLEKLQESNALEIWHFQEEDLAVKQLQKGTLIAAIVLDNGYGEETFLLPSTLKVIVDPSRKRELAYLEGMIIESSLRAKVELFTSPTLRPLLFAKWLKKIDATSSLKEEEKKELHAIFIALQMYLQNNSPSEEIFFNDLFHLQVEAISAPLHPTTPFAVTFPAAILWAMMSCTISFTLSLVREKRRGTMTRLQVAPISPTAIVFGKASACFLSSCLLFMGLILIGITFTTLKVESWFFLVVGGLCSAFSMTGLMILFSTIGSTEEAVSGASRAAMIILMMAGGGMVPLFMMSNVIAQASLFNPVRWAIFAIEGAIWRHLSTTELLFAWSLLIIFGSLFLLLGILRFRKKLNLRAYAS